MKLIHWLPSKPLEKRDALINVTATQRLIVVKNMEAAKASWREFAKYKAARHIREYLRQATPNVLRAILRVSSQQYARALATTLVTQAHLDIQDLHHYVGPAQTKKPWSIEVHIQDDQDETMQIIHVEKTWMISPLVQFDLYLEEG